MDFRGEEATPERTSERLSLWRRPRPSLPRAKLWGTQHSLPMSLAMNVPRYFLWLSRTFSNLLGPSRIFTLTPGAQGYPMGTTFWQKVAFVSLQQVVVVEVWSLSRNIWKVSWTKIDIRNYCLEDDYWCGTTKKRVSNFCCFKIFQMFLGRLQTSTTTTCWRLKMQLFVIL